MSSRARSSDDDLASRFDASVRVRDGAHGDAIERAFSVPKDFNQELESKSNVELRALMTDDGVFLPPSPAVMRAGLMLALPKPCT